MATKVAKEAHGEQVASQNEANAVGKAMAEKGKKNNGRERQRPKWEKAMGGMQQTEI